MLQQPEHSTAKIFVSIHWLCRFGTLQVKSAVGFASVVE